jgi:two-component system, NarL family, sensor kinase
MEEISQIIAIAIVFILLIFFIMSFFFIFYKKKKEQQEILQIQQAIFAQAQIEIQEQMLTNISQELHDNIGQTLTVAKLNLSTIKVANTDDSIKKIDTAKQLITHSLTNIRDLAKSMLGEKITEIGLQQAMQNELKILENTGLYKITFFTEKSFSNISPQHELIAFRIVQETLHNIVKHAQATSIDVQIKHISSKAIITIADNGKGFDSNKFDPNNTGIGLKNMISRSAIINAEFTIKSSEQGGTVTTLILKD